MKRPAGQPAPPGPSEGYCRATRSQGGSVTAETAVVVPVMALFVLSLCWVISLGIAQVQVVDAARDAARGVARGESSAAVVGHVERTAPSGARTRVSRVGGLVTVTVEARIEGPSWLLVPLPAVTLRSESTVAAEETADAMP